MIEIRPARPAERGAVANVLDGAGLALAHETLVERLRAGTVLVAEGASATAIGAIVLTAGRPATGHILAVAVRRRRRGQGIGTRLVRAAAARYPRLVAACDVAVAPFYRRLGFRLTSIGPDRVRGELRSTTGSASAAGPAHSDRTSGVAARPP